jgi:hypothetical protein
MAEQRARVAIVDQTKGTKYTVLLPTNAKTEQVLPQLVKQLNMPLEGPGGAPMQYDLTLEAGGGRVRLKEDETLAEAGVQDGAVLRITPRMEAGAGEVCLALL